MDRNRILRMKGQIPRTANTKGNFDTAFDVVDLFLWIVDLFGAILDLMRDFGDYLLGE